MTDINIQAWARWFDFEINGTDREKSELSDMVRESARLIVDIDHGKMPRWLSLLGTSGAGKTKLSKAAWNWYLKSRHFKASVVGENIIYPGTYVHWPELASDILDNQNYARCSELATEKFLVLDEIGLEKDKNGFLKDMMVRLLCQRTDKWTMITGNVSQAWVEKNMDARVASRMTRDGSVVVDVNVRDYENR